ncbi:MAG: hypothetical protein V1735_01715 [Nanoarchaeota archaeon]
MASKIPIALVLSCLLLLSACGGGNKEGKEGEPFTTQAHTGTEGITLKFLNDLPPREVYYSGDVQIPSEIPVMIEVRNKGAYETSPNFYLDGYDPTILAFYNSEDNGRYEYFEQVDSLEGKSNANPEGGYQVYEFRGDVETWPEGLDAYDFKLKVTACYDYETVANPLVCIDPRPFYKTEDKACRITPVAMAGGQGAPVAVTSISEQGTESKVHFSIKIKNVGTGVVFDSLDHFCTSSVESGDCCPYSIPLTKVNVVNYNVDFMESDLSSGIECKPEGGRVRLVDGIGSIFCTVNTPQNRDSAFKTPLTITLNYGYKSWIERDVRIRNAQ